MNTGINGDESMKIDSKLLAKIWYKSMFLLHPNATFKQCADAVYNSALMTKGLTFKQLVCIRTAFGEAGIDVESNTSHNVLSGTTVYAISYDNKKYQNYHVKVIDCETSETVDEKNITNTKGYKLDLKAGKYIISLTDNDKNGSKNTFNKTLYVRSIPNKKVNSYINILTDFFADYDASIQNKLKELISEYGIASDETYTANTNVISDKSWTHRKGIVSAKLSDLDGDGINELVVVRLIGGDLNPYSEDLEFSVYYSSSDGVESADSMKFYTGDDFTEKNMDSFIRKIGKKKYIFLETDFAKYGTDVSLENAYTVLEYNNHKLTKKVRVYYDEEYDNNNFTSKWIEVTWNGDVESEKELFRYFYDGNDTMKSTKSGEYKDSESPVKDYFIKFGLSSTNDTFPVSRMIRFFNSDKTEKLCEIKIEHKQANLLEYISSVKDYSGLDHSNSTTSPEQAENWKLLYIEFFNQSENKNAMSFTRYNFVDVDENGIPEIVYTGDAAHGTQMAWIKDGIVQNQVIGYGEFKYIPSQKKVYCQWVNHGIYNDNVYTFNNQELVSIFYGQILPKENGFENPGWFIDSESITESEYNSRLNNAFDFNSSKSLDYDASIEGKNLINKIKNY